MGLFTGKEIIKCLNLREDYILEVLSLSVDELTSQVVSQYKNNRRYMAWLLIHQLLKPIYSFPGIKDGTRVLLICSRDVRFDPLGELGDEWNDENIRAQMKELADEQQYKVEKSSTSGLLSRSMAWLSAGAFILIIAVALIGVMKYYGG